MSAMDAGLERGDLSVEELEIKLAELSAFLRDDLEQEDVPAEHRKLADDAQEKKSRDASTLHARHAEEASHDQSKGPAEALQQRVLSEKEQRALQRQRKRVLLVPSAANIDDRSSLPSRSEDTFNLVGPRIIADALEGDDTAAIILNTGLSGVDVWGPSMLTHDASKSDLIAQDDTHPRSATSSNGFMQRLVEGFMSFDCAVQVWVSDSNGNDWQGVESSSHPHLGKRHALANQRGLTFEVLRVLPRSQQHPREQDLGWSHVVLVEIFGETLDNVQELPALRELSNVFGRAARRPASRLTLENLGEMLCALEGTQILAASEHLYFNALDMLRGGDKSTIERLPLSSHRIPERATQVSSAAPIFDADKSTKEPMMTLTATATSSPSPTTAREETNASNEETDVRAAMNPVVASTLAQAFLSQGVDRVCARFREHALRNIWSEISQRTTNQLAATGEAVRGLQHSNEALRLQRDAAMEQLRDMRRELARAKESALEANRKAREEAATSAELRARLESTNCQLLSSETRLESAQADLATSQGEVSKLSGQLQRAQEKARKARKGQAATDEQARMLALQLKDVKTQLAALREKSDVLEVQLSSARSQQRERRADAAQLAPRARHPSLNVITTARPEGDDVEEDSRERQAPETVDKRRAKSPQTPRINLEDALAALARNGFAGSPLSPLTGKQAHLPTWARDPQTLATSFTEDMFDDGGSASGESVKSGSSNTNANKNHRDGDKSSPSERWPKSNNDAEKECDAGVVVEEKASENDEDRALARINEAKEKLLSEARSTAEVLKGDDSLVAQFTCLQSQIRLFQRTSQLQKGIIIDQERRIAVLKAQVASSSNAVEEDCGPIAVGTGRPRMRTGSGPWQAARTQGAYMGLFGGKTASSESQIDPQYTATRLARVGGSEAYSEPLLQDDSGSALNSTARLQAHEEEMESLRREHRMAVVTMENSHRVQIKSLQDVMKQALLEAQQRRESTAATVSTRDLNRTETQDLERELEDALARNSQLEDEMQVFRSRICEQECSLDEKETILQAKDQLLQAYASQIRLHQTAEAPPRNDLYLELLGKVASRTLDALSQVAEEGKSASPQHNDLERVSELAESTPPDGDHRQSVLSSKDTVIAGLRCQIESQIEAIETERRATQAALADVEATAVEKLGAQAQLEAERAAHETTRSLLADAEACIRSHMEHMRQNPHVGLSNDLWGQCHADEEEDERFYEGGGGGQTPRSEADKISASRSCSGRASPLSGASSPRSPLSAHSYTVRERPQLRVVTLDRRQQLLRSRSSPRLQRKDTLAAEDPRVPADLQGMRDLRQALSSAGTSGREGGSGGSALAGDQERAVPRAASLSSISARIDSSGQILTAMSSSSSAILAPALEHIERLEEAFRTQRAQIRVYHGMVDQTRNGHDREVTSMRRVAAGLHASRVAIEMSFRAERAGLLARIDDLGAQLEAMRQEQEASNAAVIKMQDDRLYVDAVDVREAVERMQEIGQRVRELDMEALEQASEVPVSEDLQKQVQILELVCERQRIKHCEAIAEARAEIEHHKECRHNLRARYNALRPQSAFELFDSFYVPSDMEATKRARIERILEDLRVTLASLEPYLVCEKIF